MNIQRTAPPSQNDSFSPPPARPVSRYERFYSIWIISIFGLFLSIYLLIDFRERASQTLDREFRLTSANYATSFTREMDGNLAVLQTLAAFAELEPNLDRRNFEPFAAREIRIHPAILALEWMPHVPGSGRAAFEQTLSGWEGRPVAITFGTSAHPLPSPAKADYFPIALMYPRAAAAHVIGFNGYSQKNIHTALDHSRDTGEPTSTAKFRVVEHTPDGFAVPIYLPVYRHLEPAATVEDRRRALTGYVLAIVEMSTALEAAIRQISTADINIQFYDLSAPAGNRLLHFHRAASEPASVQPLSEEDALAGGPVKFIQRFPFASRDWAIVCTPTAHYLKMNRAWEPWAVFAIGLLATVSLVSYMWLQLSYAERAEGLVGQLFRNNARLNREIEERKKAEQEISRLNASLEARVEERTEELRESEERYALAARGSKDGLWDWNLLTGKIHFSTRWKQMLGYGDGEVSESPEEWFRRMHPDEAAAVRAMIQAHCSGETTHFQSEHRMLHKDGAYRWMLSRGVAVRDDRGRATRLAGSQTDITEGKVADALTGLPNRIFLADRLQQAIERGRDSAAPSFAVLFLDLDRFKIVNDSLGHKAGDLLLRGIAARLESCCVSKVRSPQSAVAARLGGDEFAVLLEGIGSPADATGFAAAIGAALQPTFDIEGRAIYITCSIGLVLGGPASHAAELLRDADTAMYRAKAQGGQRFEIFDAAMRQSAIDRMQLESDLRNALARGEMTVYYQPKVCLSTGEIVEFEALVRWNHPTRGVVTPQYFVPLADETGLIFSIGEWVLADACRQLASWRRAYRSDIGMSVNISARQFETSNLGHLVRKVLGDTGLPAGCLSLEVTESLLLENAESAIRQLSELRDTGIGLKIDDFGTGFSSLSYLHRLPFNELKIDRSFITGFGTLPESRHIVHTIIRLARLLEMKVVAEGVETEEQAIHLTALACDYAQGNYFSQALPAAEAEKLLAPARVPYLLPSAAGVLRIQ